MMHIRDYVHQTTGNLWVLEVWARHDSGAELTLRMLLPRDPDEETISAARGAAGVLLERALGEI